MSKASFKVGDKVSWCGAVGTVTSEILDGPFSLEVTFGDERSSFTADGRFLLWHTEPSLVLLERPKRKVTKTVERWVQLDSRTGNLLENSHYYYLNAINVKLTGTYEIEVEDDE